MPGYKDQGYDPCNWLGLLFRRTQTRDEGQWEGQFCPFGTITTQGEQSRCPDLKVPRTQTQLWLMSNSRPFWSSSGRWSGMVIDDLRCLCIGILIAPRVFWLPHFLPTDVTLVTTQPLEAALEHEATNCFSRESSSAGEKQLPSHCGLEGHWTANHAQVQVITCSWQKSNSYKAKQATALLTHALFFPFDCGCWLRC